MNTIIVYASKHGSTEKCATLLSKQVNSNVEIANLKDKKELDLHKYNKVIIGGSIYAGKIQKEVTEFCLKNMDELKDKKLGIFICAMQDGGEVEKELEQNFPQAIHQLSLVKGYFGGEFNFDKMNFLERFIVKKITKVTSSQSNLKEENIRKFAQAMNSL